MDWADDVAYSVHDVEDGVHGGLIELGRRRRRGARAAVRDRGRRSTRAQPPAELAPVLDELLALPTLRDLAGYDGTYAAQVAAKRATSELIGRLRRRGGRRDPRRARRRPARPLRRRPRRARPGSRPSARCSRRSPRTTSWGGRVPPSGRRGSAACSPNSSRRCSTTRPGALDRGLVAAWHAADDDAARLRVVIDQVAQLTDTSAIDLARAAGRPRR